MGRRWADARSNTLGLEDVEGQAERYFAVRHMLHRASSLLEQRFRYLGVAPWAFCKADTVDGAAAVLNKIQGQTAGGARRFHLVARGQVPARP